MVVGDMVYEADTLILGGGPGGYTAAIRAADLGQEVVLVESVPTLGGVCLAEGCIPSKALIHAVEMVEDIKEASAMGIVNQGIDIEPGALKNYIQGVVEELSMGISNLMENREIEIIHGHGRFIDKKTLYVDGANTMVHFQNAVIATGSSMNGFPKGWDSSIWDSSTALSLPEVPDSLLIIGGGYIGLEIGQAYAGLGSRVTLVELSSQMLSEADPDLVEVVLKKCRSQFESIFTDSRVESIQAENGGFKVKIQTPDEMIQPHFSRVMAAVGRSPNTDNLGLDTLGIALDENGRIPTDEACRTSNPDIFAIGDITRGPALAHKAAREGKVAAEVIAGRPSAFDNVTVPAILFTSPQIAWTGLTETHARLQNLSVNIGKFPLTALGRAKACGKTQGFVKIIADREQNRILGMGIVGSHASELIAEGTLAIEMGACLEDLLVSIHPHPTFSESIMEAAEMAATGSVHLFKRSK